MEVSPRGGGNRLSECIKYATGVDMITSMVQYSVGLPVDEVVQKPYNGYWAELILHSNRTGKFKCLRISDEIEEYIFEKDLWIKPGTCVGGFEAANEAIGTIIMKFDNKYTLEAILTETDKYVNVILE